MAWPAPFPGWLLEPGGDAWPRGMTVTPQGAQDPAYRPTPLFLLASLLAVSLQGLRARVNRSVINPIAAVHGLAFHEALFAFVHERGFIVAVRMNRDSVTLNTRTAIPGLTFHDSRFERGFPRHQHATFRPFVCWNGSGPLLR